MILMGGELPRYTPLHEALIARQSYDELLRKRKKAVSKAHWTQEDFDEVQRFVDDKGDWWLTLVDDKGDWWLTLGDDQKGVE